LGGVARDVQAIVDKIAPQLPRGSQIIVRARFQRCGVRSWDCWRLAVSILLNLLADCREFSVMARSADHHLGAGPRLAGIVWISSPQESLLPWRHGPQVHRGHGKHAILVVKGIQTIPARADGRPT